MSEQPFRRDQFVTYPETGSDLHLRVLECERTNEGVWIVTAEHDTNHAKVRAPAGLFEPWHPHHPEPRFHDYKARP